MRMFLIQDMNSHPVFAIDNAKHSQVMLMDTEYIYVHIMTGEILSSI